MLPVYAAKAGGFFFIVFGVTALMGGLLSINPVWKYGPYDPSKVTAGSQPDWYMGIPTALLRIMPNWETHIWGTRSPGTSSSRSRCCPMALLSLILMALAVPRGVGHRRQARAPPARPPAQRADPHGVPWPR
jgi:ubiquinol-cytochrome c reductase cytochrome b subunit